MEKKSLNKIILVSILTIVLLTVSFTSVSAQSSDDPLKLKERIKSLEKKIKALMIENDKLKKENDKLKKENDKLKKENDKLKKENDKLKNSDKSQSKTTEGTTPTASIDQRSLVDRPDDVSGPQIHIMYILPNDGIDESLDIKNGKISTSVAAFQKWFASQTKGRHLQIDTYQGSLDITFFRLDRSDAKMNSYDDFIRDEIESELKTANLILPNKIYAVYYGGSSDVTCGNGAWPPEVPGVVVAEYLKADSCGTSFTGLDDDIYWNLGMLHEILHAMGVVATCASHHTQAGHVSDNPRDLMYAGPLDWYPSVLDFNNDDYFNHGKSNCPDLMNNMYIKK